MFLKSFRTSGLVSGRFSYQEDKHGDEDPDGNVWKSAGGDGGRGRHAEMACCLATT